MRRDSRCLGWKIGIAIVGVLFFALISAACSSKQRMVAPECLVTPDVFCGPYESLWRELPVNDRKELEESALGAISHRREIELYVRNAYGLWENNPITRFFHAYGVVEPDIMSDVFLQGFSEYLHGRHVDMVKITQKAVRDLTPPIPPPEPPRPKGDGGN